MPGAIFLGRDPALAGTPDAFAQTAIFQPLTEAIGGNNKKAAGASPAALRSRFACYGLTGMISCPSVF